MKSQVNSADHTERIIFIINTAGALAKPEGTKDL